MEHIEAGDGGSGTYSFYCRQSARGSKIIKLKILSTVTRLFDTCLLKVGQVIHVRICVYNQLHVCARRGLSKVEAGLLMLPQTCI